MAAFFVIHTLCWCTVCCFDQLTSLFASFQAQAAILYTPFFMQNLQHLQFFWYAAIFFISTIVTSALHHALQ
jgi:hypothetical protein